MGAYKVKLPIKKGIRMSIKMSYLEMEFLSLCGEYLIHPAIAFENELIQEAYKNKDIEEIKRLLEEEF